MRIQEMCSRPFGKYAFVAYDMLVGHMAFFIGGVIDAGVEILPMKALHALVVIGVCPSAGPRSFAAEAAGLLEPKGGTEARCAARSAG